MRPNQRRARLAVANTNRECRDGLIVLFHHIEVRVRQRLDRRRCLRVHRATLSAPIGLAPGRGRGFALIHVDYAPAPRKIKNLIIQSVTHAMPVPESAPSGNA